MRVNYGSTYVDSVYDALGNRVTKTVSGQVTKYIGQLYECTSGVCTQYIFAGTKRIAQVKGSNTYYYHTDHLESSTVITDQNGNKVEELFYYPFGEILTDSSPTKVKYKFAGHEFDAETELDYMGARYYDPKLARFISADTIVPLPFYPQSLNRYSYTMNNPIVLRELDGHDSTGVAQFTSPSSPSYYSPSAPTNPSAISTATNNAVPPAPAAEAAGATTDNDGTQKGGGSDTGENSKTTPQQPNNTQQPKEALNVQEPGIEYDPSCTGTLSNKDTRDAVKELGGNLDADRINITGADRTEEGQEKVKRSGDTKTSYENSQHGAKQGYKAADVQYFKGGSQIPPKTVGEAALNMPKIGGVGIYPTFTHIDIRPRGPNGKAATW